MPPPLVLPFECGQELASAGCCCYSSVMQQVLQLFEKCLCNGKKSNWPVYDMSALRNFLQKELKYLVDGRNSPIKLVVT